jgi:hypothetical protein
MSNYRDPYAYTGNSNQPYYVDQTYRSYNPYEEQQQPNRTYDPAGYDTYRDEPFQPPVGGSTSRENALTSQGHTYSETTTKEAAATTAGFGGETPYSKVGNNSPAAIRAWRYDHQGNLWTKGGRGRCIGRFCCCTLFIFLFLLASIVLSLALWIRPPNIIINGVNVPKSGSTIQATNTGLTLNLNVNITVSNPNYFSVNFREIKADITYPLNNTDIGGGSKKDVTFGANTEDMEFDFPFSIVYKESDDPNHAILIDLATKCGIIGGKKTQLSVNYKITLGLRILFITISPVVSNKFRFDCPISSSDIGDLLKNSGINLGGLVGSRE